MSTNNTVVPLFKNRTNANVVLNDGTLVAFANKQFYTQDEHLIKRLKACAERGEFGIFIDPADADIDLEAATPMERLRKSIRAELEAEMRKNGAPVVGATSSAQAPLAASVATTVSTQPEQQNQALSNAVSAEPVASTVATDSAPAQAPTKELTALEKLKANAAGNQQSS